jgi:uncharacterized protein YigA (DUF484 family)
MSNEPGTAQALVAEDSQALTDQQVADYLLNNPDFFLSHGRVLAEISLPHESGKAVSLLERQVSILRNRDSDTRARLNNLLDNARNNDQLFETTRNLVLALLRAKSPADAARAVTSTLKTQDNIDYCELILTGGKSAQDDEELRADPELVSRFPDVFRLKRTHCGTPSFRQLEFLFDDDAQTVRSTALCPVFARGEPLALLAIGNERDNYFNINLDSLFLDFIGSVVGAVLSKARAES